MPDLGKRDELPHRKEAAVAMTVMKKFFEVIGDNILSINSQTIKNNVFTVNKITNAKFCYSIKPIEASLLSHSFKRCSVSPRSSTTCSQYMHSISAVHSSK